MRAQVEPEVVASCSDATWDNGAGHTPFCCQITRSLDGEANVTKPVGDNVITATWKGFGPIEFENFFGTTRASVSVGDVSITYGCEANSVSGECNNLPSTQTNCAINTGDEGGNWFGTYTLTTANPTGCGGSTVSIAGGTNFIQGQQGGTGQGGQIADTCGIAWGVSNLSSLSFQVMAGDKAGAAAGVSISGNSYSKTYGRNVNHLCRKVVKPM